MNLDLAVALWQFGCILKTVPCSRGLGTDGTERASCAEGTRIWNDAKPRILCSVLSDAADGLRSRPPGGFLLRLLRQYKVHVKVPLSARVWTDSMRVIPAIDMRGGRCVRLRQGDFGRETIFGEDIVAMAEFWASEGATRLHLVDLDGAREGRPVHVSQVREIVQKLSVPCQLGGGVRDEATIASWLEAGVDALVVGTKALEAPDWFRSMAQTYPNRLLLGLDAKEGKVATGAWLEDSEVDAAGLAGRFDDLPLCGIVYTDIARDGMLEGANLSATEALARQVKTPVIASGGVGSLIDLERLAALPVAGCIVGRALYEGRFRLQEAREHAGDRP